MMYSKSIAQYLKSFTFILILALITSSCATISTRRLYNVNIKSNAANAKIRIADSSYNLPAKVKLARSKDDLEILLITDSVETNYTVKSSPNAPFLYGNLIFMHFAPAGYLIDFTNQKRFYYGRHVFLNKDDSIRIIRPPVSKFYYDYFGKKFPSHKGVVNLTIGLPYINVFFLQPPNEPTKRNLGFWGLSAGLEYFYRDSRFISLKAYAASDFFAPFIGAIDISGEYELMSSLFVSLTQNYALNRFSLGYGLSYSRNIWDLRYYEQFDPPQPGREPIKKKTESIGFQLNGYHQFNKLFLVGMIYRPSLLRINPSVEFKYEHLISVEIVMKLRFEKPAE